MSRLVTWRRNCSDHEAVEVIRANGMSTVWESQWRFAGRPVDAPKAI